MSEKIYCGSVKFADFEYQSRQIKKCKLSLSTDDINAIVKYMKQNNLKYINIESFEKREPKFGFTHGLQVDFWKPEPKSEPTEPKPQREPGDCNNDETDLPF